MGIKVTIGGDFYVTPDYVSHDLFTDDLRQFFKNSDLNVVNLECPVSAGNNSDKIIKTGPHLKTTKEVLQQLKSINVQALTLANNHILDYGQTGLENTLQECQKEGITPVGAGRNLAEASKPAFFQLGESQVALINFCENEWSIATNRNGGANPLDIIDNLKQIKTARKSADFVLVIIHGGHEIYNLPSPRMVKQYRFYAENGADAVIGHHPHCISGFEYHNDVPVVYSLGNMLFTMHTDHKGWYTGLLVQLILEKGKPVKFELHPIEQSRENFQLSFLNKNSKTNTLAEIENYCGIINDDDELMRNWEQFLNRKKKVIHIFSPLNVVPGRYTRAALSRMGFNNFLLKKKNLSQILNHIRCEAHRDLLISLLQKKLNS